jgi:hypothetical protein
MAYDRTLRINRNAVLVCPAYLLPATPYRPEMAAAALVEMENGRLAVRLFRGDSGPCSSVVDLDLDDLVDALTNR